MPHENKLVTRGVDFNGGNDSYEDDEEYDNEFEEAAVAKNEAVNHSDDKNTQEETFRKESNANLSHDFNTKEYYSKKANQDMVKDLGEQSKLYY